MFLLTFLENFRNDFEILTLATTVRVESLTHIKSEF